MRRTFPLAALTNPRAANPWTVAAALFALGVAAGAVVRPSVSASNAVAVAPAFAAASAEQTPADIPLAHRLDPSIVYPAEVIRIIDGDTFEARVRVWPGLDVDTKVRLRGVDAAELHARCASEFEQAQAARVALEKILSAGGVTVSRVGVDKYGGRIDATIATRATADVSAALLNGGFARPYDGGKRGTWCG
ncbi:MAG: thermonuclease family protein [Xanthobacteraceae bacterium]